MADGETTILDPHHVERGYADLPASSQPSAPTCSRITIPPPEQPNSRSSGRHRGYRRPGRACDQGTGRPAILGALYRSVNPFWEHICRPLRAWKLTSSRRSRRSGPALQADGGDIVLKSIGDDGVVHVELVGACGTCPVSTMTLKAGVERIIKDRVPGSHRRRGRRQPRRLAPCTSLVDSAGCVSSGTQRQSP